jgi:uncharacterized protein (DUF1800 family)
MRAIRFGACLLVALAVVGSGPAGLAERSTSGVPANPSDRVIVHTLNRLGFGPAPGDVERVRTLGLANYIDQQLHPERVPDTAMTERLATFDTLNKSTREMAEEYFLPALMARRDQQRRRATQNPAPQNPGATPGPQTPDDKRANMTPEQMEAVRAQREALSELMQAKVLRAAYSERQLQEVLVDFWFNHFNVFSGKGPVRLYLNEYERDAIRPHVVGKFRDLLGATAESPAMLFYLDNWQSSAPEGARTSGDPRVDSRRARPFGRPGQVRRPMPQSQNAQKAPNRPRGLNENYARELMELHTLGVDGGYTQKDVQEVARAFTGWTIANPRQGGSFRFEPRLHDDGEKMILGHKIKAGGGQKDGEQVLDILAKHPATARFVATKLSRRFVADEPPKALIDRAAQRFTDTDGDIREVVRTIVTSPEFFAADAYRAKVKTPFEFVVSSVRATGTDARSALMLVGAVRNLGMPLYGCQPPTGYADKAEAWVNSGALLNRMNFAVSLTSVRRGSTGPTITSDTLVASALAGEVSESTATTIAKATTVPQALALVLGSPEFQRR